MWVGQCHHQLRFLKFYRRFKGGFSRPGARRVLFVFHLPKGLIVGPIVENSEDFRNAILTKIRSARFELLAF